MKTKIKILLITLSLFLTMSCTSVDSGFEAPIVSFGGETNMSKTLGEGLHWGFNYLWDETPEYEIREQTLALEEVYFDKNDMKTPVGVTVYFNPIKGKTNYLHKNVGPDYKDVKLIPLVKGALSKVIPQYSAQALNKEFRGEAEVKIKELLAKESEEIFVNISRIQLTKITIPTEVAKLAEETAVQLGRNELAKQKEAEEIALAKAKVAKAQGDYDAGVLNAKTQELLSQPKLLELQKLENEKIMWEGFAKTGKSPFGENNIFGQSPSLLLNRK